MNKIHLFFYLLTLGAFSQEAQPEQIVQIQVEAYNNRDIEAFLDTYAQDVKIYNYPNILLYEGKDEMRKIYTSLFEETPNLFCEIKKRIVINNKVIDEEYVRYNNHFLSAVAIYEVKENKIIKVTFLK